MSHKHGLAAKKVSNWRSSKSTFQNNFFRIAGTSEGETLLSGKVESLLAIDKDKKSKLPKVTFSFKPSAQCQLKMTELA